MSLLDGVLGDVGGLLDGPSNDNGGDVQPEIPVSSRPVPSRSLSTSQAVSIVQSAGTTALRSTSIAKTTSTIDSNDKSDGESDDESDERSSTKSPRSILSTTTNRALANMTSSFSHTSTSSAALASISLPPSASVASMLNQTTLSSQPNITSGSSTYPAAWTLTASESVTVSTLIIAGPAISASIAEGNQAVKDENIFHTNNKLFPLAVIAVVVAGLFFLMTTAFIVVRLLGWNRKRRNRKLTPSFYPSTNTMFEPKLDMIGTSGAMATTRSYDPIASTVDLHRNGSQNTIGSDQAVYNVAAPGPASTRQLNEYGGDQAYDGAFFPSQPNNPFLQPGEYYPTGQTSNGRTLLPSSSTSSSQQGHESGNIDEMGSPVPSFNTGRIYAQVEQPRVNPAPTGSFAPGQIVPSATRAQGANPNDEYSFNMLTREPSNGSNLMSRTRAMKAGVRRIGPTSASEWQEGTRGRVSVDEESVLESYVSTKSSKQGKQATWGSDRV